MNTFVPANTPQPEAQDEVLRSSALAQRLLHGCGWFALCVGSALAALTCWLLDGPLMAQPQWAHQVLGHFLWGRVPTLLVAWFVVLRLNLHGMLTPALVQGVLQQQLSPWGLGWACVVTATLCWMWLLLVASVLTGVGAQWVLGAHAQSLLAHVLSDSTAQPLWHAGLRLLVLAMTLAWVSFIEWRFFSAPHLAPGMAFMRAMVLGALVVLGLELADFFLFFA